jgi:hypothetical protein
MFVKSGVRRNAPHDRSSGWSRLLLLAVAIVAGIVLLAGVILVLAATVTIDTFDQGYQNLNANWENTVVSGTADVATADILGGERDVVVTWDSGDNYVRVAIDSGPPPGSNRLGFSEDTVTLGEASIIWDGNDDDADGLDNEGLGGEDLTDNGTNDGVQLLVYSCDAGFDLRVTVYTGTNSSVYTLTLSQAIAPPGESRFMPFSDFEVLSGTGAVFTSAGAVVFDILPAKADVDLTLDLFESTANRDFGDLPATYNTTLTSDGPRHVVGDLYLGSVIDREADGFPSDNADGDDDNNYDDEDGVVRTPGVNWEPGTVGEGKGGSVDVTVTGCSGTCYLNAWIDWDDDDEFTDTGDQILDDRSVSNGDSQTITFNIPAGADVTDVSLYTRFRLCDAQNTCDSPTGEVTNGEVEDYQWYFSPTAVTLTRLDAISVPSRSPVGAVAAMLAVLTGSVAIGGVLMRRLRVL